MKDLVTSLRPALLLLALFTLITGVIYPVALTAAAQAVFPHQANGSMIRRGDQVVGSELVGQTFAEPGHFWGRPSAVGYDATTSGGTNRGVLHPDQATDVAARIEALRAADPGNVAPVPVDLVTASGSGLDPHISPAAAYYQVPRVARSRGLAEADVRALVEAHVEGRTLGFLGEPRVSVLRLNLAVDAATSSRR